MTTTAGRVAALYDIHGNAPALEATLSAVQAEGVDQILVGGDVLPGPMPKETLELLRGLEIPTQFIYGNGEQAVLAALSGEPLPDLSDSVREAIQWTGDQLTEEDRQWIASWPATHSTTVSGVGTVLFCHATPRDENEIFTVETPAEALTPIFAETFERVVVCGHTHMQFDRAVASTRVVNAGSVGMPFGTPGAHWLLLGPEILRVQMDYNRSEAAERIRNSPYPGAMSFANTNVLQVPLAEAMLSAFSDASLG